MPNKEDKFKRVDSEQLLLAMTGIMAGFAWSQSQEGSAYWERVYERLQEISRFDTRKSQGKGESRGN